MAERKLQKRVVIDQSLADLLAGLEKLRASGEEPEKVRERKARERAKIQARRSRRATYDLPPALREQIKTLAEEQRVPASQIVTLALARFLCEYADGKLDLITLKRPSRSPRYDWNLSIPDSLLLATSRKSKSSKKE